MLYNDKLKLDNDLLPRLGHVHVRRIDYNLIDSLIADLHSERNLSQSSLKKYVVLVRKVLKEAQRDGTIEHIPALPAAHIARLLASDRTHPSLRSLPPQDNFMAEVFLSGIKSLVQKTTTLHAL